MLNKWRLIKSCRKQFAIVAGVCYLVTFLLIFNSFELRNDAVREEDFLHALSEYDMDVYALVDMAEMTHGDATGRNLSVCIKYTRPTTTTTIFGNLFKLSKYFSKSVCTYFYRFYRFILFDREYVYHFSSNFKIDLKHW